MDFNFNIEDDTLYLNMITPTEQEDTYQVKKTPIINKEAFIACFENWLVINDKDIVEKGEEPNDDNTTE